MWRSRRLVCTFALILLASIPFWLHEASEGTLPLGSPEDFPGARAPRVPTTSLEQDRNAQAARRRDVAPGDGLTDRVDEALGKTAAGDKPATTDRLDVVARETSPAAAARGIGDPEADEANPAPDTIYDLRAGEVSREHERVALDPLWLPADALSTRITGVDYGAPRKLILWRVDRDRSARLAVATSEQDGYFDFGQILVPSRGLRLVATADGEEPEAWQRDRASSFQPRRSD